MISSSPNHSTSPAIYADFQGLNELRAKQQTEPEFALRRAAEQFEAFFVQMMLSSMRSANLGEGILDSQGESFYQDMYDKQLSVSIADGGSGGRGSGLGLVDMLMRQLGGETPQAAPSEATAPDGLSFGAIAQQPTINAGAAVRLYADNTPRYEPAAGSVTELPPTRDVAAPEAAQVADAASDYSETPSRFNSPGEFVRGLYRDASAAAEELGVAPEALLAQAALESGWGRSLPKHGNGETSHNLFGIKATSSWSGDRVVEGTKEFEQGAMRDRVAAFRAYPSYSESFSDYVDLLRNNSRYGEALKSVDSPDQFFKALQQAGYATDPQYAEKLMQVMSSRTMRDALDDLASAQG